MGAGIAQACAVAGIPVTMIDVDAARITRARTAIGDGLARSVSRGTLAAHERAAAIERLRGATSYEALSGCDFVIEAATEDEALKIGILRRVGGVLREDAVIATNTSSISIGRLAATLERPAAFVGTHFFNPVARMNLVEVVRGPQTGESTVDASVALAKKLGKTPVVVKDAPGFVVNRLLCPMLNEAALVYSEGIASASDIDEAMKLGCNHPIGPLALCDLIGIDVVVAVMKVFHRDFQDPKYRPAPLLEEMAAAGRLGRKTGRGFYTYDTP